MGANRMTGDVLLVGSLPAETVEEALTGAAALGNDATALPDGEVGDRSTWVTFLPIRTYSSHPDLVETRAPTKYVPTEEDEEELPGQSEKFHWTFQVKPGVEELEFENIGYGDIALESYATFRRLRDEGGIAPGVRFQVSLPAVSSGVDQFFDDPSQWPMVHAAYVRAIKREIAKVLETIPADDLAIQFDLAWEVNDLSIGDRTYFPFWPTTTFAEKFQRHTDLLAELTPDIPEDVVLGFHWCYGTWGGWPMTEMPDLELCVELSNHAVPRAGRRVDYVHMPVTLEPDEGFFAPLGRLDIGETKVYLGLVHQEDGLEGCERRIELAKKSLPDFGIGAVCGYGREEISDMSGVYQLNRACAECLRTSR